MTTTSWLNEANEQWRHGDAVEAGRLIYERLEVRLRPKWADGVLGVCCAKLTAIPAAVEAARAIAQSPARWHEAHAAFQPLRELTLAAEKRRSSTKTLDQAILELTENVPK